MFRMPLIAFAAWLVFSPAHAADLTGIPRIVDGDTLAIGSTKVRLQGIDASETDQVCLNAIGDHWTCGIEARDQLRAYVAGREIRCSSNGIDAYRGTLGTCYLANEDLNAWMGARLCAVLQGIRSCRGRCPKPTARTMARSFHCPVGLAAQEQ
jgi:endonuclease YncB( thermonuclease family)